jgi:hypothetical protein
MSVEVAHGQETFEKEVQFNSKGFIKGNAIISTTGGGYLVGGGFRNDYLVNDIPCLIKFNSEGDVEWAKSVENTTAFEINAIAQLDSNYFFAAGHIENSRISGLFILKSDMKGNIIWVRGMNECIPLETMPLKIYGDGSCVLGGETYSQLRLMRIDSTGSLVWFEKIISVDPIFIRSMILLKDSSSIFVGNSIAAGPNKAVSLCIMKINPMGRIIWRKLIRNQSNIEGYSICTTSDNGFAVSGRSGDQNIYVAKFDSLESFEWVMRSIHYLGLNPGNLLQNQKMAISSFLMEVMKAHLQNYCLG